MDNPQHYQPLSHALHPPRPATSPSFTVFNANPNVAPVNHREEEEEEEEEEEDDEDEGIVEQQLNDNDPDARSNLTVTPEGQPSTSDANMHASASVQASQIPIMQVRPSGPDTDDHQQKRRPGRPRGSKNRPRPLTSDASQKQQSQSQSQSQQAQSAPPLFYTYKPTPQNHSTPLKTASTVTASQPPPPPPPPQHPDVNAQNQQYYEFQWRVLNLCGEFYGAAEELVKATPPLVLAQCYHMGPSSKIDPLVMLAEAKRVCDSLLANPAQLIVNPPPPLCPVVPAYVSQHAQPPPPPTNVPSLPPAAPQPSTSTLITNPQSFVVSLGTQPPPPTYPHPQYPSMYQPAQFPAASYYTFPGYAPPGATFYSPAQPQIQQQSSQTQTATINTPSAAPGINQGSWSDEETERLKKIAEQSRSVGTSGEIEWDWVVHQWGSGRTRHQILIKATSLGLKESSSRGIKRRRDNDAEQGEVNSTPTPVTTTVTSASTPSAVTTNATAAPSSATIRPPASESPNPIPSRAASTPGASPLIQHQSRPPGQSSTPVPTTSTSHSMPWPMPTVAANTPSPVVVSSGSVEPQRTSYYRAKPSQDDRDTSAKQPMTANRSTHRFVYQPNGSSVRSKENGK